MVGAALPPAVLAAPAFAGLPKLLLVFSDAERSGMTLARGRRPLSATAVVTAEVDFFSAETIEPRWCSSEAAPGDTLAALCSCGALLFEGDGRLASAPDACSASRNPTVVPR